jgi:hypothetical protein
MRRRRIIYFLLLPPIVVGLAFAAAGLPYYDNVMVWCNNSANWWPEVPVILAILYVSIIMGDIVLTVHKKEKASHRYTGGSNKLSNMVFKQAMYFVGAFYLTWVPYLVLQYMWSRGTGYNIYGLTLAASTMVPLQGFYNFLVYARPRYFNKDTGLNSLWSGSLTSMRSTMRRTFTRRNMLSLRRTGQESSKRSNDVLSMMRAVGEETEALEFHDRTSASSALGNRSSRKDAHPDKLVPNEESKHDSDELNIVSLSPEESNENEEEDVIGRRARFRENTRLEMCIAG